MQMMHAVRRLRAEHADLLRLAGTMRALIDAPIPPHAVALAAVRAEMRDALVSHLRCEDWALYPRLRASGDEAVHRLVSEFVDEMGHIAEAFTAYDAHWTGERIAADWAGFCAATRAILDVLIHRINRENHELYPLAEALESARCSDGAASTPE